ncbi:MAG: RcpC/CpaB family pilus assembly protein [Elusimicrobiales bacterium]
MKMLRIALVCAVAITAAGRIYAEELGAPGGPVAAEAGKAQAAPAAAAERAPAPAAKVQAVGLVKGYRGTSVTVGGDQLLFLKKGDRVDVLVTFDAKMEDKDGKERKEKVTSTFLQNVVVINVHKPAKVSETGAVELLLNPVEAQYAALAIAQGDVSIVVRAPGDTELHPMEIASFRKLIK